MKSIILIYALCLLGCSTSVFAHFDIVIDAKKDSFYTDLKTSEEGFVSIPHTDFLPVCGPRPEGQADLSAQLWMAWDSIYFYIYAEIKDDSVIVNNDTRPQNDCVELKFDPDPTQKANWGIVNARLSALDSSGASRLSGVDNLYSEGNLDSLASQPGNYARRLTNDGYIIELRLNWSWIRAEGREVNVKPGNIFGFAINIHDNDSDIRNGSIQWSPGMADEVWTTPQLLGTAEFLDNNRIRLIRKNVIYPESRPGVTFLSNELISKHSSRQIVIENWLYHPDADLEYIFDASNEGSWEIIHPVLEENRMPAAGWNGLGWFKTRIVADSSIWGVPLAFHSTQSGASEIYLNGDSLYFFGKVSEFEDEEEAYWERNPRIIVFNGPQEHVLTVRYSNTEWKNYLENNRGAGFTGIISRDIVNIIDQRVRIVRDISIIQIAFSLIPAILMILHLFLFVFYRHAKENLYFAICMFCWAVIGFTDFQGPFFENFKDIYIFSIIGSQVVVPAIFFGLLTIYSGIYGKIPRQIYFFLVIGIILNILLFIFYRSMPLGIAVYVYIAMVTFEILRLLIYNWIKHRRIRRATLIGFSIFMLAITYQLLSNLNVMPRIGEYGIAYVYGLLVLSLSVSLDLSLNFARTNRDLEKQLDQVKFLSEKNLRQERRMREQAIKRKLLEADNERKTKELEEARHLQLSMLPTNIPAPDHLEIAATMHTANEVGGDYYDFSLGEDKTFTVAIGDATGHGMKAGTMVASVKSLFAAFGDQPDIRKFFNRCTDIIKEMQMGNIFMGMMLVRFNSHIITAAAAGMPPIFIYRAKTGTIDELVMKGMPLGASRDFKYQQKKAKISEGDTILLMTDGFPELFNKKKEMIDYPKLKEKFAQIAANPPQKILDDLVEYGEEWRQDEPQADDFTFVVVKVRKQAE